MQYPHPTIPKIIILLMAMALIGCQAEVSNTESMTKARAYLAESDTRSALIELKNAARADPSNAETRYLFGATLLEAGDFATAESELGKALDRGYDTNKVMPLLAKSLIYQSKFNEVIELPDAPASPAEHASFLASKSLAYLATGDIWTAREFIEQSLTLDPLAPYSRLAHAKLALAEDNVDEARTIATAITEDDPEYAQVWALLGDIAMEQRDFDSAVSAYSNSLNDGRFWVTNSRKLAMAYLQNGQLDKSSEIIDPQIQGIPRDPTLNYIKGRILYLQGEYGEALKHFDIATQYSPPSSDAFLYTAYAHWFEGSISQAEFYANKYFNKWPDNVAIRTLLSLINYQKGQLAEAEAMLQPVIAGLPSESAMLLYSGILLKQQKNEEALDILQQLSANEPESADVKTRIAAGYLAAGSFEPGVEQLESLALEDPQLIQPQLLLYQTFYARGEFDKALEIARRLLEAEPDKPLPYQLMCQVYLARKETDKAKELLAESIERFPEDTTLRLYLADITMSEGDSEKAVEGYRDILKLDNGNLAALFRLAVLAAIEKDDAEMVELLQQAVENNPNVIGPKLILARYYIRTNQPEKVGLYLSGLSDEQMQARDILEVRALGAMAEQQYQQAKEGLLDLSSRYPKEFKYHYLLARVATELNEDEEAVTHLKRAADIQPQDLKTQIELARLYFRLKRYKDFSEQAEILATMDPESAGVLDIMGTEALLKNKPELAEQYFQQAYTKEPDQRRLLIYVRQLNTNGKTANASQLMEDWLNSNPNDVTVRLALADTLAVSGKKDAAVAEFKKVLAIDENNLMALNNLAWNTRKSAPEQALEHARKAATIAPRSAQVQDTLAMVYLANGLKEEASLAISKALEQSPTNSAYMYHEALIYRATGNLAASRSSLESALEDPKGFSEKKDAEKLYEELSVPQG
jgi:putative PEP-CTERM system TPR-repeat lipoprotein